MQYPPPPPAPTHFPPRFFSVTMNPLMNLPDLVTSHSLAYWHNLPLGLESLC